MNYLELLATMDQWVQQQSNIEGAAIVGSYARGDNHSNSDIDIVLITPETNLFTENTTWLSELFPTATNISHEIWGATQAFRFWLDDLEVELNFCPPFWASIPVEPGTANVVHGGMTLLRDTKHVLQKLIDAVEQNNIVNIRTHLPADGAALAHVFHNAVHAIPNTIYNETQKAAWAPEVDDLVLEKWQARIEKKRPFVAEYNGEIVGFIELEVNGYIDCFYIDPKAQSLGIGGMLYQQVVNEATGFGIKKLTVHASKTARPFFENRGFSVVEQNLAIINGVELTNYLMAKDL
jgi:putative acetyltransferase